MKTAICRFHLCDVTGWRPMEPLATPEATYNTPAQSHRRGAIRSRDIAAGGTRWLGHPAFRALTGVEAILMPHQAVPMLPPFYLAHLARLIAPFLLSFL